MTRDDEEASGGGGAGGVSLVSLDVDAQASAMVALFGLCQLFLSLRDKRTVNACLQLAFGGPGHFFDGFFFSSVPFL